MYIEELLQTLEPVSDEALSQIRGRHGRTVATGIAYDSRRVKEGSIFVAIPGALTDGHRYLAEAKRNGAILAIVETIDAGIDLPQLQVKNSRRALSYLSAKWFSYPSRDMIMTGITGSNGKTTTAMMLDAIFAANHLPNGMLGTIFYRLGDRIETADLTTPESLELHGMLRAQADYGFKRSVMEVSSISVEQCRVADITYDVMAFINITREHIDQHGTFEAYLDAKMSHMRRLPASSIAVVGADDPVIMAACSDLTARTVSFGVESEHADVRADRLDLSSGFGRFDLVISRPLPALSGTLPPLRLPVSLNVPGLNSVYNALAALTMAMVQGVLPEKAAQGIARYEGIERRFQRVYSGAYQMYDDHFANAGNIRMSLRTVEQMTKNKLHLAFAVRGNRGVTVNREVAEEMALWKDRLPWGDIVVTLSRDVTTPKDHVTDAEADVFVKAFKAAGYDFRVVDTLNEAMVTIVDAANDGDIIILGGAQGMDPGARIALNYLLEKYPALDPATILAPLEGRLCG